MNNGGLFTMLLIVIVFFLILYAVVRAAVISGMKEHESEKTFSKRQALKENSNSDD